MQDRRSERDRDVERRAAERADVRCEVEFLCGGVLYSAIAENLSAKGVFVAAEVEVFDGMPVDVCLTLDDASDPIKLVGKVVRLARRRDERPGFAVAFDALDDATRRRIQAVTASDRAPA